MWWREREREMRGGGGCTYTCQVTLEQMVKSKYSTAGTRDSGLTQWVCVHVLVYSSVCTWMLEVSDELRGGERPAAQRQTAGLQVRVPGSEPCGWVHMSVCCEQTSFYVKHFDPTGPLMQTLCSTHNPRTWPSSISAFKYQQLKLWKNRISGSFSSFLWVVCISCDKGLG